jgi:hypothetical protein
VVVEAVAAQMQVAPRQAGQQPVQQEVLAALAQQARLADRAGQLQLLLAMAQTVLAAAVALRLRQPQTLHYVMVAWVVNLTLPRLTHGQRSA